MADGVPEKCVRYTPANVTYDNIFPNCSTKYFDKSQTMACDSYVYESRDSIVFDVSYNFYLEKSR